MLPTDPEVVSGLPSENRSILFGTSLGLGTVLLGTKLMNTSPLSKPVHLVLGGVLGAIGGYLMCHGARAMQERVILGEKYYKSVEVERLKDKEQKGESANSK